MFRRPLERVFAAINCHDEIGTDSRTNIVIIKIMKKIFYSQ